MEFEKGQLPSESIFTEPVLDSFLLSLSGTVHGQNIQAERGNLRSTQQLTFPEFYFETEAKVDFPSACI